ncbi:MAG TPA: OmpA family protein [Saprospiraceae bacterium]|jgi:OOP family OmpA-OmpF porin|nr:OmpA family protein [Saprospiraceae bacterium]HRO07491.1 OmpA family protein [Saprospiraceae bacterium]HRP40774.1 OmpA family protein [Saprospiraceae bacterium]
MKNVALILFVFMGSILTVQAQNNPGLPENPQPGKCYIKCITKDEFKTEEVKIKTKPEYSTLKTTPAVYKDVTEKVLVKEASKKLVYVPAVYETIDVPYVKKEKGNALSIVPAAFGSSSETVETFPTTSRWEYKVLANCPDANKENCMTACFTESPAQSKTVAQTTLTKDAFTTESTVAEVGATYKKQVVKTPARMDEVEIPAEYATITKTVLVTPAKSEKVTVPAEYTTVTKQVLTKKGGITVWEEVDCKLLSGTPLPIFYKLNSAELTSESKKVIDQRLLPLLQGKQASVEIMSHTDAQGNPEYNMALSQQRAQSVVDYLASKGINRSRMIAKGFGDTQLINHCKKGVQCTDAEHQKNRRTEFRILGN